MLHADFTTTRGLTEWFHMCDDDVNQKPQRAQSPDLNHNHHLNTTWGSIFWKNGVSSLQQSSKHESAVLVLQQAHHSSL